MNKFFIIIFTLLALATNTNPKAVSIDTNNPLVFKARIYNPKTAYLLRESIWVEYFIVNTSGDTVWVSPMVICGEGTTSFDISDEKEKKKLFPIGMDNTNRSSFGKDNANNIQFWKIYCIKINPKDTIHGFYDLVTNYNLANPGFYYLKNMVFKSLVREGEGVPAYPPFWKGILEMPLNFMINIKAPQGNEKAACNMFFSADKKWDLYLFKKVIKTYPNSVYAPKAQEDIIYLMRQLSTRGKYSDNDVQDEIDKLVKSYPNSPYSLRYKNTKIFFQE